MKIKERRGLFLAGFLAILWVAGCAYGDFWIPEDDVQRQPAPSGMILPLGEGRTLYRLAPRDLSGEDCTMNLLDQAQLKSYRSFRTTTRVFRVSDPYLWLIIRSGGLLSGKETGGVIELQYREGWGTRLTEFNSEMPSDHIQQIDRLADGRLLIGGEGGGALFDPAVWRTDRFDDWNTFDQDGGGLSGSFLGVSYTPAVRAVAAMGNSAFFGAGTLFRYDLKPSQWKRLPPKVLEIPGASKRWSFETRETVKVEWKDKQGKKESRKVAYNMKHAFEALPVRITSTNRGPLDDDVDLMKATSMGLWVLTPHGVSLTADGGTAWKHFVESHESWTRSTRCVRQEKVGVAEKKEKVCSEELTELAGRLYEDTGHGLPGLNAVCVEEVAPGEAWLGFAPVEGSDRHRGGLARYANGRFTPLDPSRFAGARVIDIESLGSRVAVATMDTLYLGRSDGSGFQRIPLWEGLETPGRILALESDADSLWVATDVGVLRLDRHRLESATP